MQTNDNHAYLVSTASFSYNDEGYIANDEGCIPVKLFLTEKSAQAFAHKLLSREFNIKTDELIEAIYHESISMKSMNALTEVLGPEVMDFFKAQKGYNQSYFSLQSSELFSEMLEDAAHTKTLDQLQAVYKVIRGVDYVQIQKLSLEL